MRLKTKKKNVNFTQIQLFSINFRIFKNFSNQKALMSYCSVQEMYFCLMSSTHKKISQIGHAAVFCTFFSELIKQRTRHTLLEEEVSDTTDTTATIIIA